MSDGRLRSAHRVLPGVGLSIAAAIVTATAVIVLSPAPAFGWGLSAHRIVTEAAAERVPPDIAAFFRKSSTSLQDYSLEPDTVLRARDPEREDKRHFINLDAFEPYPFEGFPHEYAEAAGRYGEYKVRKEGTLPWRISGVLEDLRTAMRRKNAAEILRQSGYLAHYVADVFQPLHLTMNYDGEETCNLGIHAAFESEMIEKSVPKYRDEIRRGREPVAAIDRPLASVFRWIRDTYPLVVRVLEADTAALRALKREGKDYYQTLDRLAGPVAERQMSAAASAIASLWYTVWIDAGKPALASP